MTASARGTGRAAERKDVGRTKTAGELTYTGVTFEIVGSLRAVETIAKGVGVRDRKRLVKAYGAGNWRKLKGIATIRLHDGTILEAELHWYDAHGIGKKEINFKKPVS